MDGTCSIVSSLSFMPAKLLRLEATHAVLSRFPVPGTNVSEPWRLSNSMLVMVELVQSSSLVRCVASAVRLPYL